MRLDELSCCSICRISRIELATVSGFFSGLATHQQPSGCLELPVGHLGVELLVEAVYSKQVQLDGDSVVDLLQAASYLQVMSSSAPSICHLLRVIMKGCSNGGHCECPYSSLVLQMSDRKCASQ